MTPHRVLPTRASRRRLGATLVLAAAIGLFVCWATGMYAYTGAPWLGAVIVVLSLGVAFCGVLLLILARGGAATDSEPAGLPILERGRRVLFGAVATVILLGVVALGAAEGYIWMPESLVPGMSAAEVRAGMDAVGELDAALMTLSTWTVIWTIAALVPLVLGLAGAPAPATARGMWMLALAIVSGAVFCQWMGTFSMGMGIADTFLVGGGHSGFWVVYSLLGQASLIALIALALSGRRAALEA